MALPIAPPPTPDDVAVLDWAGITVRVAWALLAAGLKVRPDLLRDARDHAILHIDPRWTSAHAEDRAATATDTFVARGRRRSHATPWPVDDAMMLSERWKRALDKALDPLSRIVLRKLYGEGRKDDSLARRLGVEISHIEGARGGLREILRRAAAADGVPVADWSSDRIDRVLVRLAAFAPGPCPPASEVADGWQPGHVAGCPRCDRLYRLVHEGALTLEDLVPPSLGARPARTTGVLAVMLHPDARAFRAELISRLGPGTASTDEDFLLVPGERREAAVAALVAAAEVARPKREHLRGAFLAGPGHWTRRGLLGPLAERAERTARSRIWGTIDGIGELPPPLPAPPAPWRWWIANAVVATCAVLMMTPGLDKPADGSRWGLSAEVIATSDGTWLDFDVRDAARVAIIEQREGKWRILPGSNSVADKATWATGDGRYRLHVRKSDGLLVAIDPTADLSSALTDLTHVTNPKATLIARLRGLDTDADVVVWSAP